MDYTLQGKLQFCASYFFDSNNFWRFLNTRSFENFIFFKRSTHSAESPADKRLPATYCRIDSVDDFPAVRSTWNSLIFNVSIV